MAKTAATPEESTEIIEPKQVKATINEIEYDIKPLKIGQIPAFTRAIKPAIASFTWNNDDEAENLDVDIVALIGEHGDGIMEATAIATGAPLEDVQDMEIDEFAEVVADVLAVNADFFTRRLTTVATKIAGKLADGIQLAKGGR